MQTLKIEIPKGYQIDSFDQLSGEIRFKETPKSIFERINTIDDVFRELGDSDQDVMDYKKLMTLFDSSHHLVNYQLVVLIAKAMNEGWVPDWRNPNEYKYYPWFELLGSSGFRFDGCAHWTSFTRVGSRLCFQSQQKVEHAAAKFLSVYEKFMLIK